VVEVNPNSIMHMVGTQLTDLGVGGLPVGFFVEVNIRTPMDPEALIVR